ncbi:hypothetical protein BZA05DRAFT_436382 [Tricharina praecox]|uniref:uncharacterized protein n=1 Tax=Tricharina praecox TaxID=43433 RepID=UPI00221EC50B|nr:uncharacterized protein BZA05DRAFT_436382 [Tricharina praecox]KAI5851984.1 hypothetical protein BZA05DRAFT_436382 [Tricharina praecox]
MHPTLPLLRRLPVHVTFFTRASCGLCASARDVLAQAWERRPFEYTEVDVMASSKRSGERGNTRWKDAYEFDVPVVHILPAREVAVGVGKGVGDTGDGVVGEVSGKGDTGTRRKLMHRFTVDQVVSVMEEVTAVRNGY